MPPVPEKIAADENGEDANLVVRQFLRDLPVAAIVEVRAPAVGDEDDGAVAFLGAGQTLFAAAQSPAIMVPPNHGGMFCMRTAESSFVGGNQWRNSEPKMVRPKASPWRNSQKSRAASIAAS